MDTKTLFRKKLVARGQVQGVGFRPFIYRLANTHALTGMVSNTSDGVVVELQGAQSHINAFLENFHTQLPPLAVVTHLHVIDLPIKDGEDQFHILNSTGKGAHTVLISPDTALCNECHADMEDVSNVRYNYPFTNCTNCGPRYTITHTIPYDRKTTSMACFHMCQHCRTEYENPFDRRFHAQPNACPACGPRLWFTNPSSKLNIDKDKALHATADALHNGHILAIKGLGGFHICCDATNNTSIKRIREKKCRPHKALAVMVPDINTAHRIAHIHPAEQNLLTSAEKPIVICTRRHNTLPHNISPDTHTIGIMLPYTPLHVALFRIYAKYCHKDALQALVMTSGNAGGAPICLGNREAIEKLSPFVDAFLLHDRDILVRTDDSVCALHTHNDTKNTAQQHTHTLIYRRARGYVPRPVSIPLPHTHKHAPVVLGVGAELKSTLCLTRQENTHASAFLSQHIGTLQNMETFNFYKEVLAHMEMLLQVQPDIIVHDMHPDFLSTQLATELAKERNIPCLALQHHFAHGYSVLAEHKHTDKALVLALDGTGLGDDGTIWGGELLLLHLAKPSQRRIGRLSPFLMPGGEKAIAEPWRLAAAFATKPTTDVNTTLINDIHSQLRTLNVNDFAQQAVKEMVQRRVNCIETSSAGRLFDAVAAGLGICGHISYEGQAAIRLETAQNTLHTSNITQKMPPTPLPKKKGDLWELSSPELFYSSLKLAKKHSVAHAAHFFHTALAQGFARMTAQAAQEHNVHTVALTGGVMHNKTLYHLITKALAKEKFDILTHQHTPTSDGAISLGQSAWGLWQTQGT